MGRSRVPVILSKVIGETPSPMCDYFPKGSSVKSTVVQTLGAKSIAKKKKDNKIQEKKTNPVELGDGIKSWTRNTLEKRNRGEVPKQNKTKQNKVLKWSKCDAEHQKYDPWEK